MKLIRLVIIFTFFAIESAFGQNNESVMPRHYFQQKFLGNELENKKLLLSDTLKVDSLFNALQKSWKSFVKDSLINKCSIPIKALNNLDAYSYYLTLRSINGGKELDNEIEYHLFKNYMLPSLINDYQFIKSNPSPLNLKLIWAGSLANTLMFGTMYADNNKTFRSFCELFTNLKVLLRSFEKSDDETKTYTSKLNNFIHENENEIETKYYLFNNQPDSAFIYFITSISTNKYPKFRLKSLGETMFKFYLYNGENDKCLSILNNLSQNTTNDELSRDTLQKWYNIADPENGIKYYDKVSSKSALNYFKIDNKQTIQLPQKWNLIFNKISQEKIKKAQYILIDFWYSACSPCIAEIPKLNELHSLLKDSENIIFLSINTDIDSAYAITTTEKNKIQFPVVADNKVTNFTTQFNVSGFPAKFIINNKGQQIVKLDGSPITLSSFNDFINSHKLLEF